MSGINVKNFVDINIKQHVTSVVSGSRGTIALLTPEGSADVITVSSMTEANTLLSGLTTTLKYLEVYFAHGGVSAQVTTGVDSAALTVDAINELDDKLIVVALVHTEGDIEDTYSKLKGFATTRSLDSSIYGVNEKIIIARTESVSDSDKVKNFAVKYSTVVGAEMTMAAYLSKLNVYGVDTVYDYAFTQEVISEEQLSNTQFETLSAHNINVDTHLADATRNLGGNCKDGADFVNTFVKIVLHQTLTERLLGVLTQKIKGQIGIGKMRAALIEELNRYLVCGYLNNNKMWTDPDMIVVDGKGNQHTIITTGTTLQNGYHVVVLPLSSLSDEDIALHKAPAVYVIIADQYGIRKITIQGEII